MTQECVAVCLRLWLQFFRVWRLMLYLDYLGYILPVQGFPSLLYGTHLEIQRKTYYKQDEQA